MLNFIQNDDSSVVISNPEQFPSIDSNDIHENCLQLTIGASNLWNDSVENCQLKRKSYRKIDLRPTLNASFSNFLNIFKLD